MKVAIFANTDWYLYNFRRSFALALKAAGIEVLLLSPHGEYVGKLEALGLRWRCVPMDRQSLNPLRELGLLWRLGKLLRDENVDLIHSFTIKCAVYGSLAGRVMGVPARINAVAGMGFVFTNTGLKAFLLQPLVRFLMRLGMGGPNVRLILQNPDDADVFRQQRIIPSSAIHVIQGSGVDCESFYPGASAWHEEGTRVLLAARLLWDKGLREYVEAARRLRESGRKVEFLLAGKPDPGNPDAVDEAVVADWSRDGLVKWLGHVEDMPSLLRSIDIVALPSYYGEGLPKSLIEAAASGCALVTTDMPGCREVVDDGLNGLLVPARDVEALAKAIGRLHDDPDLRDRFGEAARLKALELFDQRLIIQQTIDVYQQLLGPHVPAGCLEKADMPEGRPQMPSDQERSL